MKYSVTSVESHAEQQAQIPEMTAEEFLSVCHELSEVSAEIQGFTGEIKSLEGFEHALRKAHNTLVDFESSAEAIKVLDLDGQLAKLAGVEAEIQNLQTAASEAVEAVAQKVDAALEEQKEGLWAKFKEFCKKAWEAIKRFFGTIWTWLRGLFGHGKLLSWKQAQCVYDMEKGFASVAKAINDAFSDPEFEKAMQNMAAEMQKAFEDPKVQEAAMKFDFSGGVTAGTEGFKIEGLDADNHYSYKAMQQSLKFISTNGNIRNWYGELLDILRNLDKAAAEFDSMDDEKATSEAEKGKEYFTNFAKESDEINTELGEFGKLTVEFNDATPSLEMTFVVADNKGKSPAQLGWNLKTCREYMQMFNKLCDGQMFNAEAVVGNCEKLSQKIADQLEKIPAGKTAATNKLRGYLRMTISVMTDAMKLTSACVRAEYAQAKYITRVLAGIKAEMRKNQKKAA